MENIQSHSLAFMGMLLLDIFYTLFNRSINKGQPRRAGGYSAIVTLLMGVVIIEYTKNHWLLVSAAIGSAFGTWAGMYLEGLIAKHLD